MSQHLEKIDKRVISICFLLIIYIFAIYFQTFSHEFLHYDDNAYVYENYYVRSGFTLEGVKHAFTSQMAANWHPVTWLSHMLDCELFGLKAGGPHIVNAVLHAVNAILLFLILKRTTGALWASAFAAALFALHPLRVESVAWIAERKDVLSTSLWLLVMLSYVRYIEKPTIKRYIVIAILYTIGLMAKPMLVTLPFVLMLLDYWPLERFDFDRNLKRRKPFKAALIWEKIPLFILAISSSIVTFIAQKSGGSVSELAHTPLNMRIDNAIISYVKYIGKMGWPTRLAPYYPYPIKFYPSLQVLGGLLILGLITAVSVWLIRKNRYIMVGWLWYIGTLVPVIGIVQVGAQAMADRYTYVPQIGLAIIIAFLAKDWINNKLYRKIIAANIAALILCLLGIISFVQTKYWKNDFVLFAHTLEVTENNYMAYNNLGIASLGAGKDDDAIMFFKKAIQAKPNFFQSSINLANVYMKKGDAENAVKFLEKALKIEPNNPTAIRRLGVVYYNMGKIDEAIEQYKKAIKLNPLMAESYYELGYALGVQKKNDEAIRYLKEAIRIKPELGQAYNYLGILFSRQKEPEQAYKCFSKAIEIMPASTEAYYNMGNLLAQQTRYDQALKNFNKAIELKPNYAEAINNIGLIMANLEKYDEAIKYWEKAVSLNFNLLKTYQNLSIAYAKTGQLNKAISAEEKSLELAQKSNNSALINEITAQLEQYKKNNITDSNH